MPASGAKRQANGQLTLASRRLCEQQVRHVGASDQQDERDDTEQDEEGTAVSQPQPGQAGRCRHQLERLREVLLLIPGLPVLRHRGFAEARPQGFELGDCLLVGLVRREAREKADPPRASSVQAAFGATNDRLGSKRHRGVEGATDGRPEKTRRRHADDRESMTVEIERPPKDIRVGTELAMPEGVADDCDQPMPAASTLVILSRDGPADLRGDAQHVEEVTIYPHPIDAAHLARGVHVEL